MAELVGLLRALNAEQKAAAAGAILLAVSTFGPFSWVEVAEILVALAVLALLRARALGKRFHLPFGDGTVIAAAGIWAAALIVARLFDRPLGQNLLALGCAAILVAAGVRERAKRPPDDIPPERRAPPVPRSPRPSAGTESITAVTKPLPPPEFEPYRPQPNEQLRLGGEQGSSTSPAEPPGESGT